MINELDPMKTTTSEETLSFGLELPPRHYEIPVEMLPWGDEFVFTYEQAQRLKAAGLAR